MTNLAKITYSSFFWYLCLKLNNTFFLGERNDQEKVKLKETSGSTYKHSPGCRRTLTAFGIGVFGIIYFQYCSGDKAAWLAITTSCNHKISRKLRFVIHIHFFCNQQYKIEKTYSQKGKNRGKMKLHRTYGKKLRAG